MHNIVKVELDMFEPMHRKEILEGDMITRTGPQDNGVIEFQVWDGSDKISYVYPWNLILKMKIYYKEKP